MTVLPPGLIVPSDARPTVVQVERSAPSFVAAPPRWSIRSVAFVLLVAFTFVVLGITIADVVNG